MEEVIYHFCLQNCVLQSTGVIIKNNNRYFHFITVDTSNVGKPKLCISFDLHAIIEQQTCSRKLDMFYLTFNF